MDKNLQLAAALVIALIALGGNFFVLSQVDQNNSTLTSKITVLQTENSRINLNNSALASQIESLQTKVNTLQNQLSAQSRQVSSLESNLQNAQSQLANATKEFNSTLDLAFQGWVYYQLRVMNATLQTLTDKLLMLQVPLSTLVVIGDSYDNATNTLTLSVQNTLNVTVYAQINAVLYGTTSAEDCNGVAGSYVSQMYTFPRMNQTVTQLSLASGLYNGCAGNPITHLSLYYMVGHSAAVSQTYKFNLVPAYNHS